MLDQKLAYLRMLYKLMDIPANFGTIRATPVGYNNDPPDRHRTATVSPSSAYRVKTSNGNAVRESGSCIHFDSLRLLSVRSFIHRYIPAETVSDIEPSFACEGIHAFCD